MIVGGAAQSTPALFDSDWSLEPPTFSFTLVGRSRDRLAAVARAVGLVAGDRGRHVDCTPSDAPLAAALEGADVVLIQFRVGGYEGRAWDETFPLRYGICGDEGLGPGGLASAWRTWPELRDTLATIAQVNPRARVILLTSPIGILTRCARTAFPSLETYGICELPWTTLRRLCGAFGLQAQTATYAYLAVNHLGWFSDVRAGDTCIIEAGDVHPLKYVRLHEHPVAVLAEQRAANSRRWPLARSRSTGVIAQMMSYARFAGATRHGTHRPLLRSCGRSPVKIPA